MVLAVRALTRRPYGGGGRALAGFASTLLPSSPKGRRAFDPGAAVLFWLRSLCGERRGQGDRDHGAHAGQARRADPARARVLDRPACHRDVAQAPDAVVHPLRALGRDSPLPGRGQGRAPAPHLPAVREQLQRDLGPVHRRVLRGCARPDEGDLGDVLRLPGPDPGRAVQAVHPRERVRRQPLLVGLSRARRRPRSSRRSGSRRRSTTCAGARHGLDPEAFKDAYDKMLTRVQRDL